MSGSVSTNRHVCSKRYEPSNVSVRCGTHIFIHLRILWIPKSQHDLNKACDGDHCLQGDLDYKMESSLDPIFLI